MTPSGIIRLPITAGTLPLSRTVLANFIVVDCPSAYNVVMGRPILVELRAVVSIRHLMIKFVIAEGVRSLQGDQRIARECYNSSISKAKKTGVAATAVRTKEPSGK